MQALRLYAAQGAGVKLHTWLRAWTCPFDALFARLPEQGRLLEVGCGHGLFSHGARLARPGLEVLGVDPAEAKIRAARATLPRAGVRFERARLQDVGEREFDAVAVIDVLYLVPRAEWPAFLAGCFERLRGGGRLLLKEVGTRPRWKFWRCLLQETLSVRLLGITLGGAFAFASAEEMLALLAQAGFADATVRDLGAGYLTPHVLYEARRP